MAPLLEPRVVLVPVIVAVREVEEPVARSRKSSELAVHFRKTQICRFFPQCRNGASCSFAHSEEELRPTPNFTKTRMCAGWADGRCALDPSQCKFAHGPDELRSNASPVAEMGAWSTTASPIDPSKCTFARRPEQLRSEDFTSPVAAMGAWSTTASPTDPSTGKFARRPEQLRSEDFTSPMAAMGAWSTTASPTDPSKGEFAPHPQQLRSEHFTSPVAAMSAWSTTASLTSASSSPSGSSVSRTTSPGSADRTNEFDGLQLVVAECITSIKEACPRNSGQASDGVPSPEECEAVLLQAMPDLYED